jgi:hypothetical protein
VIGLIGKTKKGSKKCYKKKEDSNTGKKDLSKVMCFQCQEMGHYNSQCPLKKKEKGDKQVVVGTVACVEEDPSQFETSFSMISCLSSNTMPSVG